jgi:REP element-mobilizing transposase RayT
MMNQFNPDIHHRKSIRLQKYDYRTAGCYFITICLQNRECLFGEIADGYMLRNPCGEMIVKWVGETKNKFNDINIISYVVMPNHFHAIIANAAVTNYQGEHAGLPLHHVVQWFKTMTTNEYIRGVKMLGWKPFNKRLWQRNYYEHIIRDDDDFNYIAEYIMNNPQKWKEDVMYP